MKISLLAVALALGMSFSGAVYAETASPLPTASASPAAAAKDDDAAKAAKAAECSKKADAKGLHGKERKKFRADCKKGK